MVGNYAGVCELVAEVAEAPGFRARNHQSPDELWTALEVPDPDVLVLDLDVPHVDGVRLLGMLGEDRMRRRASSRCSELGARPTRICRKRQAHD